jgi:hypothetical protein
VTLPRSGASGADAPEPRSSSPYDGMDDRALVARVCDADSEALEALYRRYGRPCYGLARP